MYMPHFHFFPKARQLKPPITKLEFTTTIKFKVTGLPDFSLDQISILSWLFSEQYPIPNPLDWKC